MEENIRGKTSIKWGGEVKLLDISQKVKRPKYFSRTSKGLSQSLNGNITKLSWLYTCRKSI